MTDTLLSSMLDVAQGAARQAGVYALGRQGTVTSSLKSEGQLVTEVDHVCQAMIVEQVRCYFPQHGILAEEGPDGNLLKIPPAPDCDYWWVIDPIDGTRNYAYGLPIFAILIGVLHQGVPIMGVIYLPYLHDLYYAITGQSAFRNDAVIQVCPEPLHAESIVGLPCRHANSMDSPIAELIKFCPITVLGSAGIHYAFLAQGSLTATVSYDVRLWDIVAGAAIATAAGAIITQPDGRPRFPVDPRMYSGGPFPTLAAAKNSYKKLKFFFNP